MAKRQRSSSLRGGLAEEAVINLTPLIDVVFVVLIMFIIVVPMLEIDKIQLASSYQNEEKKLPSIEESSPITIYVRADNSIWFGKDKVSEEGLFLLLKQARGEHPSKVPQLFHDKKATFGTYQAVKNAIERAGFEELDLVLEPN